MYVYIRKNVVEDVWCHYVFDVGRPFPPYWISSANVAYNVAEIKAVELVLGAVDVTIV